MRIMQRTFQLLGVVLVMFFVVTHSNAQKTIGGQISYKEPLKYKVAGIVVVGTEFTDAQAIKLFSGLTEGKEIMIPGDEITDAVHKLWKQHLFKDIQIQVAEIRGTDIFLVIEVKEMERLGTFRFDGISKSEADNIREKLDLRSGRVCDENLKMTAKNSILDFYVEKGFFNTDVIIKEIPDPIVKNGIQLTFEIKKGKRVKIEWIDFKGNELMSDKKLHRALKNTKQQAWWRFWKASKYIVKEYEEDLANVVTKYNKDGFRNAKVVKDSLCMLSDNRMGLTIYVEEDKRFYFGDITFVGNTKYQRSTLDSILSIKRGDLYNLELLNSRLNYNPNGRDLSSLYTDDGYLNFYSYPIESLVLPDTIDVEIRMGEGKQFRIGEVGVSGNSKTNDHVIYREIRTRPGDLFNRSDLMRSQRELNALGFFNPEAFDIRTNPNPDKGTVDLEYVVEEKPSDQIQLSGGWGGGRVMGTLSLSFNNFSIKNIFKGEAWSPLPSGDGQRLTVSANSNGVYFQSYNLSFTEPWLGGKKPNSLTYSVYHSVQSNGQKKYVNDVLNPLRQSLFITGGALSFGQKWQRPDDWFYFYSGLSFQHLDLQNYGSFFSFNKGYVNNLAGSFTIERNSVSDPIYPTWGSKITLTSKFTFPYTAWGEKVQGKTYDYANMTNQQRFDWVEYYKIKFTAHWYTALNKHKTNKFVLNTNVGFGFLGSYNKRLGQSPIERFYLGGVYLSGFQLDSREIVNLRGYDDLSLTMPSDRVGASVISKYSAELRYPLTTSPSATIFALTFLEAGRTWADFSNYDPFNLYKSGGVGVRIFLPMFGLLGFDYGWRFDDVQRAPNMAKGQFHFSIGMNLGEL
jgi:outer membrane protein insertion porin family